MEKGGIMPRQDDLLKLYRRMAAEIARDDGRRLAVRYVGDNRELRAHYERVACYAMVERIEDDEAVLSVVHEIFPYGYDERRTGEYEVMGVVRNYYSDVLGAVRKNGARSVPYLSKRDAEEKAQAWRRHPVTLEESKQEMLQKIEREIDALENGRWTPPPAPAA